MVIMNHPQSLKILKSSDLMPYVVFVAPPSLQQVDSIKMRNTLDFTSKQARKLQATLEGCNPKLSLARLRTGVKCRATSVAKKI